MTAPGEPLLAAPSSRLCSPLPPERLGSGRTLLPLGPTTAPPGVGRARVAARLATTSCSFRCPHRPRPAWCGAQSLETLSLCHRGKARLASPAASLGVSPSSLQRAGQSVAEVAAMTVVPASLPPSARWMPVQTLPRPELCHGERFSWSDLWASVGPVSTWGAAGHMPLRWGAGGRSGPKHFGLVSPGWGPEAGECEPPFRALTAPQAAGGPRGGPESEPLPPVCFPWGISCWPVVPRAVCPPASGTGGLGPHLGPLAKSCLPPHHPPPGPPGILACVARGRVGQG